jgi:RecA/RadA recombinase
VITVSWLPTRWPELDAVLGGGLPLGRLVEVSGRAAAEFVAQLGGNEVTHLDAALRLADAGRIVTVPVPTDLEVPPSQVSRYARQLCSVAARSGALVVFVRPERSHEVDVVGPIRFYASIRLVVERAGAELVVRVVKNKLAPPFQTVRVALEVA